MMKGKDKLPVIISFSIFVFLFGLLYYLCVYQSTAYYTRIDNMNVEQLTSSDMKYEYHLVCYNASGKAKNISFKTSRKLRNGAYLQLEVMMIRGVKEWWEVSFDDLPAVVQTKWKVLY